MAEAESLFEEAMGDEKCIRISKQARLKKFSIDSTLRDEIQQYIIFGKKGRKPFEPNSADDLKDLIKDMQEVQSYRDRLTGILIGAQLCIDDLTILVSAGEAYLYGEYSDVMKKCGNKETREAAVRYVFGPVVRRQKQWKSLKVVTEMAMKNLNETYYALREIGENGRTILAARKVRRDFDER